MASGLPALKRLIEKAWIEFQANMRRMGAGCAVRPNQAGDIFKYVDGEPIEVEIRPITFFLKEKPSHARPTMYVVVQGLIHFRLFEDGTFRAVESRTRVGYFLKRDERIEHVYGVHHDFDGTHIAHPVFHSQIAPMRQFLDNINESWNERYEDVTNHVQKMLTNVRIPSAQMDAFSVFLQLCSDHLVHAGSVRTQIAAYRSVFKSVSFFRGAFPEVPRLQSAIDETCLRPHHWYDCAILPAVKTDST